MRASDNPKRASAAGGSALFCAGAAILIGHALLISDGRYDGVALRWIGAATVLAWAGFIIPLRGGWQRPATIGVCVVGIVWQIFQLYNATPFVKSEPPLGYYVGVIPVLAVSAVAAVLLERGRKTIFIPIFVVTFFLTGVWMLRITPRPGIDVFDVNKESAQALLHGVDPYTIDFPDIYMDHPDWEKAFYPPGIYYGGRVHFGYAYMPLSLLTAFFGHVIGGDFRYGNLAAVAIAVALLAYAKPGPLASAGACLLALTPRAFYVVQYGWAEPVVVLCMAWVIFCALRRPGWLPWAFGLLLVSKQHMILAAPAVVALLPRPLALRSAVVFLAKAVIAGTIVTLPFVLWNFHAFWFSVVHVQLTDPFRFDSLNFAAAWAKNHAPPPVWLAFVIGAAAAVFTCRRVVRTPAGFAAAVAVIYLSFFALSKQTFCNYYFLVIGALCCCVAAAEPIEQSS